MYLGQEATRNRLADLTRQLIAVEYTDEAIKRCRPEVAGYHGRRRCQQECFR